MPRTPGRPRTRTRAPADLVHVGCRVTVAERDALLATFGLGGVSRVLQYVVRAELARAEALS